MNISNIDDLLMGKGNSQQPETPENKEIGTIDDDIEPNDTNDQPIGDDVEPEDNDVEDDSNDEEPNDDGDNGDTDSDESKDNSDDNSKRDAGEDDLDEYGNKKERMSKGMRDRLERKEKQHQREIEQRDHELNLLRQQLAQQGASSDVQNAAKNFKYDPNDEASWQDQLRGFVEATVSNMGQKKLQEQRVAQEQQADREFQQKFTKGMERFSDFKEIVGAQPIDDPMTMALRGMSDPTAFIYAASKRHPQELQRISQLRDPYAKYVEMGKLEERMRRNKPATSAPKPLGRVKQDVTQKTKPKPKDTTGDDLLAKADAKRLTTVRNRHKSNR